MSLTTSSAIYMYIVCNTILCFLVPDALIVTVVSFNWWSTCMSLTTSSAIHIVCNIILCFLVLDTLTVVTPFSFDAIGACKSNAGDCTEVTRAVQSI